MGMDSLEGLAGLVGSQVDSAGVQEWLVVARRVSG